MAQPPHPRTFPASRAPRARLAVDRAVSELRRGRPVAVRAGGGVAALVLAAEAVTAEALDDLRALAGAEPVQAITGRRAAVLGLGNTAAKVVTLRLRSGVLTPALVLALADPLGDGGETLVPANLTIVDAAPHGYDNAAVGLAKAARLLLPSALTVPLTGADTDDLTVWCARHDMLLVDAGDVFQYELTTARTLKRISEAQVPLLDAQETRIIAFRPFDGGLEHLAIVIGRPDPAQPVLTRLHSECFTGDLLGSLRCDCGDQLRGAIQEIAAAGAGVLLYLAQEGRGIGLVNKLRAYELQDRGLDTIDANEQLGFDADERVYLPAAQMLRDLNFARVRLLTNNPDKVSSLAACGVEVTDRVPHAFPSNRHNELYLKTKASRSGHLF